MQQYQRNLSYDCGFGPPVCSSDRDGHYAWCLGADESNATIETEPRENALKGCMENRGRCEKYAATAVARYQENIALDCGFEGPAWSNDTDGHRSWCEGVDYSNSSRETSSREASLKECRRAASYRVDRAITIIDKARKMLDAHWAKCEDLEQKIQKFHKDTLVRKVSEPRIYSGEKAWLQPVHGWTEAIADVESALDWFIWALERANAKGGEIEVPSFFASSPSFELKVAAAKNALALLKKVASELERVEMSVEKVEQAYARIMQYRESTFRALLDAQHLHYCTYLWPSLKLTYEIRWALDGAPQGGQHGLEACHWSVKMTLQEKLAQLSVQINPISYTCGASFDKTLKRCDEIVKIDTTL